MSGISDPDSANRADEPSSKFEPRHRHQADLVVQEFKRLLHRYDGDAFPADLSDGSSSTTDSSPAATWLNNEEVDEQVINYSREDQLERLHSSLLPCLQQQLDTLLLSLDEEGLQKDPGTKLELIFEMPSKIDHTFTQIKSASQLICPEPLSTSNRADDQTLKQSKSYRLDHLSKNFHKMARQICRVFHMTCEQLEGMRLATSDEFTEDYEPDHTFRTFFLEQARTQTSNLIQSTLVFCKGSELDLAQDVWKEPVQQALNFCLAEAMSVNARAACLSRNYRTAYRKGVRELFEISVTLMKLSRLFFNKLSSGRGMNRKRLPSYTEMNSMQLKSLLETAHLVTEDHKKIVEILWKADLSPRILSIRSNQIIKLVETLAARFDLPLLLIVLYIIPLFPELDDQNHLKVWFPTWNTQFILAINNFKHIARSLDHDIY
ncbi:hypothetical protein PGT21_022323 [Puccinia graminis f. sp. tritici]|uniref:Uncharacterized protein n=2 Tax=Puccinia graminis f. sp. tritici TaxID=56615 RepID=A0A5B0M8Z7_PUCGR|nr:hypothetical protein PGT21_022323 [Puccinia graminis f. sp. tritici]KAA1132817.1 hypothetical protein PGTUg99_018552 [Puccinia graminis f. sp. tritici]